MHDWSQGADVLDALESGRKLTQLQALNEYGIGRLAAVVCELRKRGYDIESEIIPVRKSNGRTAYVAQYSMRGE